MANLPESSTWDAGVYQIETTDDVVGGVNGISNVQAKALANRTKWLRNWLETGGNFLARILNVDGSGSGIDADLLDGLHASELSVVVPGCVILYAGSAAPAGYLSCNGALISRTTYSALFSVIGTQYGAGNGTTTFAVPDLRGEFIRGWDAGRGVDAGRSLGSVQMDDIKAHTHGMETNASASAGPRLACGTGTNGAGAIQTNANGGAETRPRNIALLFAIKY